MEAWRRLLRSYISVVELCYVGISKESVHNSDKCPSVYKGVNGCGYAGNKNYIKDYQKLVYKPFLISKFAEPGHETIELCRPQCTSIRPLRDPHFLFRPPSIVARIASRHCLCYFPGASIRFVCCISLSPQGNISSLPLRLVRPILSRRLPNPKHIGQVAKVFSRREPDDRGLRS